MSTDKTEIEQINEKTAALSAFFPMESLIFKVGAKTEDKSKGKVIIFLNSVSVRQRLNSVLGPANWKTEVEFSAVGVRCRLCVRFSSGGEWIWREDVSHLHGDITNNWEREYALKQGASDAFNRAAVQFGVGEYLYAIPDQWVPIRDGKYWISGKEPKLASEYLPKNDKSSAKIATKPEAPASPEEAKAVSNDEPAVNPEKQAELIAKGDDSPVAETAIKAEPAAPDMAVAISKEEMDVINKYISKAEKNGTRDGVRAQVDAMNAHEGLSDAAKLFARTKLKVIFKSAPKDAP